MEGYQWWYRSTDIITPLASTSAPAPPGHYGQSKRLSKATGRDLGPAQVAPLGLHIAKSTLTSRTPQIICISLPHKLPHVAFTKDQGDIYASYIPAGLMIYLGGSAPEEVWLSHASYTCYMDNIHQRRCGSGE